MCSPRDTKQGVSHNTVASRDPVADAQNVLFQAVSPVLERSAQWVAPRRWRSTGMLRHSGQLVWIVRR